MMMMMMMMIIGIIIIITCVAPAAHGSFETSAAAVAMAAAAITGQARASGSGGRQHGGCCNRIGRPSCVTALGLARSSRPSRAIPRLPPAQPHPGFLTAHVSSGPR